MPDTDGPGGPETGAPRVVAVHSDHRSLELWPKVRTEVPLTVSGVRSERLTGMRVYGADGRLRVVRAVEPLSWPNPLLARLPPEVYDPPVRVRLVFTAPVRYDLPQLVQVAHAALAAGGWRSYVQMDPLNERLSAARTFAEVVAAVQWAQVESPFVKEQADRAG